MQWQKEKKQKKKIGNGAEVAIQRGFNFGN